MRIFAGIFLVFVLVTAFTRNAPAPRTSDSSFSKDTLSYPEETHLQNIQQLTFGGDNAEAYFSFDGKWLIFQG